MKYSIGLDIGISSVGWAVINLDLERIERMGVRVFDKAENPDGSSLSASRREARSVRRRLRRRRYRVSQVRQFILRNGLLTQYEMEQLYDWLPEDLDVWLVRVNGLERKLTNREFARILIHLAKNRGFKSNRKSDEAKKATGVVLSAINENIRLMQAKGYRTVSEMLLCEEERFQGRKRNKGREYTRIISRGELENEVRLIFERQRELGQSFATKENEEEYLKIWNSQRPFASKDDILSKVGNCIFEKNEKRAPKFSFSFERFRALDKLNRLKILSEFDAQRMLSNEERENALQLLFEKREVTYKDLRKLFQLKDSEKFNKLFYDPDFTLEENENNPFLSLEGQWNIRKAIEEAEGKEQVYAYRPIDIDTFAYALTVFKNDKDICEYLNNSYVNERGKVVKNLANREYHPHLIDSLLSLSFTKFGHLSMKAIHKLLPFLEEGDLYHEACKKAGYELSRKTNLEKQKLLPVIPVDEVKNPVLLRALSQTRKVINAIIKRYGTPSSICIELAREMGRPYNERREWEKAYKKNREINEKNRKQILELHPEFSEPRGHDILKYKLWQEQNGLCAYSIQPIMIERLFEHGYAEVDHIIPYSRSFDDSNSNKVLVFAKENRNKQNRTPYEWFGHNEAKWQSFTSFVKTLAVNKKKKDLLLKMNFDDEQAESFRSRHVNDNRYFTSFIKTFIEQHLQFLEEEGKKQYVFSVNGTYTSLLRKRWGFNKEREKNDLQYALDAVIVAVSHQFCHQVYTYFAQNEIMSENTIGEYFPEPWDGFRREVEARMIQEHDLYKQALESLDLPSYNPEFIDELEPIFVSRMPKRSMKGKIHEDTLRRYKGYNENQYFRVVTKTKLENIHFDNHGDFPMYNKESDPKTYEAIKQRYLESGMNKKKAFTTPLYKPAIDPSKASIIRSVKIEDTKNRVVELGHKTVAENASIVRTEVFQHKETGRFYLAPIYVPEILEHIPPKKLIVPAKSYENWIDISNEYEFLFNLYPNDLIKIKMPKEKEAKNRLGEKIKWQEGFFYFKKVHSRTAQINIIDQMNSFEDAVGSQRLLLFEKYQVDPLGNISKVEKEKWLWNKERS